MQLFFCFKLQTRSQARHVMENSKQKLTFLELLQSTLWAALGVQKSENRIRDFSHGNPWHFVLMGIGFTTFFVVLLVGVVNLVLTTT